MNSFTASRVAALAAAILLSFTGTAGSALADDASSQSDAPQLRPSPDDLKSVLEKKGKLTLEGYIHAVDTYYPQLKAADRQMHIANAVRMETRGPFDPYFSTNSGYARLQNTSRIGIPKQALFNDPKIEKLTRSGISIYTQFRYNPETAQSPFLETGSGGEYSYGVIIPALRNLFINEATAAERQAKLGEKLAIQTFSLARFDTLLKAGSVYWNWVATKQKADIQIYIRKLAHILAGISREQEQAGDLAKIFVTEAEEDVARREANYIQAIRSFQRMSFSLSMLLFEFGGTPLPLPTEENVPGEIPPPVKFVDAEIERNIQIALDLRPELKGIVLERSIAKVDLQLAKNQILPQVTTSFSQGYDNGFRGIGHVFRGQVSVNQPLGMHKWRGRAQAAQLRIEKLNQEEQAAKQKIRNEVLDAVSAINLAYDRCIQLKTQVEKAQAVYEGERERFQAGDSTVFLVTQRERQLTEAKLDLIDAQVEYQLGALALRVITCQI